MSVDDGIDIRFTMKFVNNVTNLKKQMDAKKMDGARKQIMDSNEL